MRELNGRETEETPHTTTNIGIKHTHQGRCVLYPRWQIVAYATLTPYNFKMMGCHVTFVFYFNYYLKEYKTKFH